MNIYLPYVYLLGWSEHGVYYYGVRFAKGCHPQELMKTYKTSSKYVSDFISINGAPDIIEIRRTFENGEQARKYEHTVLRRMKVVERKDFLNKTDNKVIDPERSLAGARNKPEWFGEMVRNRRIGKKHSEEIKQKISASKKGVPRTTPIVVTEHSREVAKKLAKQRVGSLNHFYGKKHSPETKKLLSEKAKQRLNKNIGV